MLKNLAWIPGIETDVFCFSNISESPLDSLTKKANLWVDKQKPEVQGIGRRAVGRKGSVCKIYVIINSKSRKENMRN